MVDFNLCSHRHSKWWGIYTDTRTHTPFPVIQTLYVQHLNLILKASIHMVFQFYKQNHVSRHKQTHIKKLVRIKSKRLNNVFDSMLFFFISNDEAFFSISFYSFAHSDPLVISSNRLVCVN